jgi:hypothetical protein
MKIHSKIIHKNLNHSQNDSNPNLNDSDIEIIFFQKIVCFLNVVIVIVGIIHNSISSIIFLQKKLRKNKFNWYLQVTSMFQLLLCLILLIDYLFSFVYVKPIFLHSLNKISRIAIDVTIHTSDSCIGILTLFLSLDRLYAIKEPLLIKEFFTHLHAKSIIIISSTSLFLIKALDMFFCEISIHDDAHIVYCALISPLIFNIIPLIIIFAINSLLIYEISHYYKTHHTLNHADKIYQSQVLSVKVELRKNTISSNIKQLPNNKNKLSTFQKSHYFVILISAFWSVFSSIPYYIFKSYFLLSELDAF